MKRSDAIAKPRAGLPISGITLLLVAAFAVQSAAGLEEVRRTSAPIRHEAVPKVLLSVTPSRATGEHGLQSQRPSIVGNVDVRKVGRRCVAASSSAPVVRLPFWPALHTTDLPPPHTA